MRNGDKTKEQLIGELVELRQRVAELKKSETERQRAETELRKYREHLKELVEQRTAELESTNEQLEHKITERKRAEEALREERDRAQKYLDIAGVMFVAINAKGEVALVNQKGCKILGYGHQEIIGKNWFDNFLPARLRDEVKAVFQKLMAGDIEPVEYFENPVLTRGGEERIIAWHNTILNEGGNIVGTLSSGEDMTEQKQAQEALKEYSERLEKMVEERTKELREAQEEIVRKEKLVVLGQLAGGLGHELRNPLGAIKNAAYFLHMALEDPEPEVKETLEILEREVTVSERIVSSLLDFARPKPPTRRKVDINDILKEVISRNTVPENVKVMNQLNHTLPPILADPDQLGQVFRNIVINAVQAMPDGGQLVIRSEVPSPGWLALSFADNGLGIPKENLEKLFEPLFTTKAKGIGLGLAVTRTIVKRHGGTIEVESELGKGSTFTVKLPIGGKEEK